MYDNFICIEISGRGRADARKIPLLHLVTEIAVYQADLQAMTLKSGEVAKRRGVNLQTIRYYERERLLPEPLRLPSGYRTFAEQTVRWVRFIERAQELGFSLAEIRYPLSIQIDPKKNAPM